MNLKTFFEQFETIAEAPGGIQVLRNLILDMAVRGKLVPQDPEDEPANVVLKKIKDKKENLYVQKKLSRKKAFLPLDNQEIPFAIPHKWEWIRLHEICYLITDGTHHTPKYVGAGIPFLSVKDISSGYLDFSNTKFVTEEDHETLCARCNPEWGDILLTKVGTTGIAVEIDTDKEFSIFVSVALLKHFSNFTYPRFLRHLLNSPLVKAQSDAGTEGIGNKNLVLRKIYNFVIPLPPIAEQKRIVAKVDELMELCDRLEAAQQNRNTLRQSLRASAFDALMNATTDDDLNTAWSFIHQNWLHLSQHPQDVEDVRRSVLQLAVRGKLVPQDQNDDPVTNLMNKAFQWAGVSSRKALTPVQEDEHFHDLPNGWTYVRLGEISFFLNGYAFKSNTYVSNSPYQLIRLGNVKNDLVLLDQNPIFIPEDIASDSQKFLLFEGDLLITMTGTKNKRDFCFTAIVKHDYLNDRKLYLNQRVGCIRLFKPIETELISIFLKSSNIVDFLLASSTGTANQANVGATVLRNLPIPLPPLAEQKRIVAKVDELMQICDQLEANLQQQHQLAEQLAASAVSHLAV